VCGVFCIQSLRYIELSLNNVVNMIKTPITYTMSSVEQHGLSTDQVPWRSKHSLLNSHTCRELVEIRFTGIKFNIIKASMEKRVLQRYETYLSGYGPMVICNHKEGHYNNRRFVK
jgi:hypothetical protein